MTALPIVLVIGLVIAGGVWAYKAHKERMAALAALAQEFNGRFFPGRDTSIVREHDGGFALLRSGSNRHAKWRIKGSLGEERPFVLFEFQYTTGSGKHKSTSHVTVLIVRHATDLGVIRMRPENFLDRFAGTLGFDDLDFASKEFSDKYHISAPDKFRKLVYDVIDDRMVQHLLRRQPMSIQTNNRVVLFHDGISSLSPSKIRQLLRFASAFLDHIPRHVTKDRSS